MKFVIQQLHGRQIGKNGIRIQMSQKTNTGYKTKCLTVHGYTLKKVWDMIYFMFYTDSYEENEQLRREKLWERKDSWIQKKKKLREEKSLTLKEK